MESLDVLTGLMPGSLSDREIVLEYEDALRATSLLAERAVAVTNWEGGAGSPDGTQGTVTLVPREGQTREAFVEEAAAFQRRNIERDRHKSLKSQTPEGPALFFRLYTTSRENHERRRP